MPHCSLMSMGTPFFISKLKFSCDKYSLDKVWTKICCHFYFRGITLKRVFIFILETLGFILFSFYFFFPKANIFLRVWNAFFIFIFYFGLDESRTAIAQNVPRTGCHENSDPENSDLRPLEILLWKQILVLILSF